MQGSYLKIKYSVFRDRHENANENLQSSKNKFDVFRNFEF